MHRHAPLDGLRAVAAVAVLLTHVAIYSGLVAAGGDAARYAQRLEVGVAIFFVISGYVLYRPFLRARLHGEPLPALRVYASRRALRIVPAYWLALTVAALTLQVTTWRQAPVFYGFAQIYSQDTLTGGLVQAWTLCIEVTFYAFLPLWARLGGRRTTLRREAFLLAALLLGSLAWKAAFVWSGPADRVVLSPWVHSLPAYLDQFALGMGLAVLTAWRPLPRWTPALGVGVAAVAFWAVSLRIGIGYELFEPYTRWQFLGRHLLYAVVGVALVAVALAPGVPVLGARPVVFLGTISYGIYLWHVCVIEGLERAGVLEALTWHPFLSAAAVALALTVAIAAASWLGLERPLLRRSRARPAARRRA